MSEYANSFDDLRGDIMGVLQSMQSVHSAQQKLDELMHADIQRVWADVAELRDELHAVSNRVEALTRAIMADPAEVAAKFVHRGVDAKIEKFARAVREAEEDSA